MYCVGLSPDTRLGFFAGMSAWRDVGLSKASVGKRMNVLFFCVLHQVCASIYESSYSEQERTSSKREK